MSKRARSSRAAAVDYSEEDGAADAFVGRRVGKAFSDGITYFGTVKSHSEEDGEVLYHVTYDDGENEDYDPDELKAVVVSDEAASSPKRKRGRPKGSPTAKAAAAGAAGAAAASPAKRPRGGSDDDDDDDEDDDDDDEDDDFPPGGGLAYPKRKPAGKGKAKAKPAEDAPDRQTVMTKFKYATEAELRAVGKKLYAAAGEAGHDVMRGWSPKAVPEDVAGDSKAALLNMCYLCRCGAGEEGAALVKFKDAKACAGCAKTETMNLGQVMSGFRIGKATAMKLPKKTEHKGGYRSYKEYVFKVETVARAMVKKHGSILAWMAATEKETAEWRRYARGGDREHWSRPNGMRGGP